MIKQTFYIITALAIGAGIGYWKGHSRVPRTVEVEKEVVRKDVQTRIVEVTRPNGTIEKVTEILDRTKEQVRKETVAVAAAKRIVSVSATTQLDYKNMQPVYGVLLQKPFLADRIELGAGINTKGEVLLTLGWSF